MTLFCLKLKLLDILFSGLPQLIKTKEENNQVCRTLLAESSYQKYDIALFLANQNSLNDYLFIFDSAGWNYTLKFFSDSDRLKFLTPCLLYSPLFSLILWIFKNFFLSFTIITLGFNPATVRPFFLENKPSRNSNYPASYRPISLLLLFFKILKILSCISSYISLLNLDETFKFFF